ncbi:MAG: hypothetical protein LBN00_12155 [Oscillospiraceae bacterium]|jgi:hypothetical protein|nr:hypothetical protein [Oscillospiraceae bacterium]
MKLDKFVNKTLAEHLKNYRPLTSFEQFALIYHSDRPVAQKKEAYEQLLTEFGGDRKTERHLRRYLECVNRWLNAPKRSPEAGHIFVADASIDNLDFFGNRSGIFTDEVRYFTDYRKAKRFIDAERREALADGEPIVSFQSITEVVLDENKELVKYYFNLDGKLKDVTDRITPYTFDYLENAFIDLGEVFKSGDIVTWSNGYYGYFGVIGSQKSSGSRENVEIVLDEYPDGNDETGEIGHTHQFTWDLERYDGELPTEQVFLREISLHIKGETPMTAELLKRVDPFEFIPRR